jgi:hypothetical protein
MNVFTTDHPLMTDASPALLRLQRRMLRGFLAVLLGYPLYLLALGPFWALDGRGDLDFIPNQIRQCCYLPTAPIWVIPHVRGRFQDYLDWWYLDPKAADRETGWD